MNEKKSVGFIGLGVMGGKMAGHLLAAGIDLRVYNRTASKADSLVQKGAALAASPTEIAAKCNVIFTIIGYPSDVEKIYLAPDGLIANAKKGSLLVDMTTSSPELARKIYAEGKKRGLKILDAPVTGGDKGARDATLTIIAGGDAADFEEALPYFNLMGKNIRLMGGAGAGQMTKLVNQTALAGTMTGMCEGIALAKAAGLDTREVLDVISGGAAGSWSLSNYGPRVLNGDFDPGFFIKHYIKDMKLAASAADSAELDLPALQLTLELYEELANGGMDEMGTQALYCLYDPEE